MRPRPPRASTLALGLRQTVTALALEPAPHGGPEMATVIAELLLEIGFFACDGRVGMWRSGGRPSIAVAAPFVWRCLTGSTVAPFPHPAHRTQQADFRHCALGPDFTPSPTTGRGRAVSGVRAGSARQGARVDSSRPCGA